MPASFQLPTTKSVNASNKLILPTPSHIIIDANGTIAAIDECLIGSDAYYYVERNLREFLVQFWYDKNISQAINRLKYEYHQEKRQNPALKCPKICGEEPPNLGLLGGPMMATGGGGQNVSSLELQQPMTSTQTTEVAPNEGGSGGAGGPSSQLGPPQVALAQAADAASKLLNTLGPVSHQANSPNTSRTLDRTQTGSTSNIKTASNTSHISSSGLISSQPSSSNIPVRLSVPEDELNSVCEHVLWRLRENRISPASRALLEHVLFQAYDRGSLKMLVYDEVPGVLNEWRMVKGIKLISFSRGSSDSQKCYFKSTTRGNLSKLFSHYVDGTDKMSPSTDIFKKIVEKIKDKPENILYITSSPLDAETAAKCQVQVVLVEREETNTTADSLFQQTAATGATTGAVAGAGGTTTTPKEHSSSVNRFSAKSIVERLTSKSSKTRAKERDRIKVIRSLADLFFKKGR